MPHWASTMTQSNSCDLQLLQELCRTGGRGDLHTSRPRSGRRCRRPLLRVAGTDEDALGWALHRLEHCAQAGIQHLFRLNGLWDEAEGAGLERALAQFFRRNDASGNVPRREIALEAGDDAPAVHVGQVQVERDEVGGEVAGERQRRGTLRRDQPLAAVVAHGLEQHLGEGEVVLDDEHHAVARLDLVAVVAGLVDEQGMLGSLCERRARS